jgi:hypothetical protein
MEQVEIDKYMEQVNNMTHRELCVLWRFGRIPNVLLDSSYPMAERVKYRLFSEFGGFTPEISKSIGWGQ